MKKAEKILIADDSKLIIKELRSFLSEKYDVETVSNGKEVLDILKHDNHEIDLLLLDIMMPELNGLEVLEKLKKNDLPVLILSSKSDVYNQVKSYELGAWGYHIKPFNQEILLSQIENLIKLGQSIQHEKMRRHFAEDKIVNLKYKMDTLSQDFISIYDQIKQITNKDVINNDIGDLLKIQKNIINLLEIQLKELHTFFLFYVPNATTLGVEEQFEEIKKHLNTLIQLADL